MTNRPIDNGGANKLTKLPSKRGEARTSSSGGKPSTSQADAVPAARAPTSPATVAASVTATRQLMDSAHDEIRRVDETMIAEMKAAISEGRFHVDVEALADRLLSDVFGDELVEEASGGDGA